MTETKCVFCKTKRSYIIELSKFVNLDERTYENYFTTITINNKLHTSCIICDDNISNYSCDSKPMNLSPIINKDLYFIIKYINDMNDMSFKITKNQLIKSKDASVTTALKNISMYNKQELSNLHKSIKLLIQVINNGLKDEFKHSQVIEIINAIEDAAACNILTNMHFKPMTMM